jgi:TPR repeat protein
MSGKALILYYLSSLADVSKKRISRLDPDYGISQEDSKQTKLSKQSVMAQMILGYKYTAGLGVEESCKASALYYEEAALEAINYVEESFGLDIVERKKLSIGPHVL